MKDIQEIIDQAASNEVCSLASRSPSRKWLNKAYLELSYRQKQRFHEQFAKLFRKRSFHGKDGIWKVVFGGKRILIPLRKEKIWLDWDTALSILGHDIEVKETYEALIASPNPPGLFIDIGANYGTHSLLFLVHHIKTLTFEPNAACHALFKEMCQLNNVKPHIKAVALGENDSNVELCYPESRTWFGSTNAEVTKELSAKHDLISETVEQKTLDEYLSKMRDKKAIIKIDTEGNELEVLRGAQKVLREIRPFIIFESWDDSDRLELFRFLNEQSYEIYNTPWQPDGKRPPLKSESFINNTASNFAAVYSNLM